MPLLGASEARHSVKNHVSSTTKMRKFLEYLALGAATLCVIATSDTRSHPSGPGPTTIPRHVSIDGSETWSWVERIEVPVTTTVTEGIEFRVEQGEVTIRVGSEIDGDFKQSECVTLGEGESHTEDLAHRVECHGCGVVLAVTMQFEGQGKASWRTIQRDAAVDPDFRVPDVDTCSTTP